MSLIQSEETRAAPCHKTAPACLKLETDASDPVPKPGISLDQHNVAAIGGPLIQAGDHLNYVLGQYKARRLVKDKKVRLRPELMKGLLEGECALHVSGWALQKMMR